MQKSDTRCNRDQKKVWHDMQQWSEKRLTHDAKIGHTMQQRSGQKSDTRCNSDQGREKSLTHDAKIWHTVQQRSEEEKSLTRDATVILRKKEKSLTCDATVIRQCYLRTCDRTKPPCDLSILCHTWQTSVSHMTNFCVTHDKLLPAVQLRARERCDKDVRERERGKWRERCEKDVWVKRVMWEACERRQMCEKDVRVRDVTWETWKRRVRAGRERDVKWNERCQRREKNVRDVKCAACERRQRHENDARVRNVTWVACERLTDVKWAACERSETWERRESEKREVNGVWDVRNVRTTWEWETWRERRAWTLAMGSWHQGVSTTPAADTGQLTSAVGRQLHHRALPVAFRQITAVPLIAEPTCQNTEQTWVGRGNSPLRNYTYTKQRQGGGGGGGGERERESDHWNLILQG